MKAAERRRHHFVQQIIIDSSGLPAHPADQADGLHDGFVSRRSRATSSPPQLRQEKYTFATLGRTDHPQNEITKPEPGPLCVLSVTQEVQV